MNLQGHCILGRYLNMLAQWWNRGLNYHYSWSKHIWAKNEVVCQGPLKNSSATEGTPAPVDSPGPSPPYTLHGSKCWKMILSGALWKIFNLKIRLRSQSLKFWQVPTDLPTAQATAEQRCFKLVLCKPLSAQIVQPPNIQTTFNTIQFYYS